MVQAASLEKDTQSSRRLSQQLVREELPSETERYTPGKGKRVAELDGLRGVAILLVLVWHYFSERIIFDPSTAFGFLMKVAWKATALCWAGVDLFFVLSGFLIGGILIETKGQRGYFTTFIVRRSARIFPAYFLLLATVLSGQVVFGGTSTLPVWSYWTYSQNFFMASGEWGSQFLGHTWSLAVEEQFYLLLPFLVFVVPRKTIPWVVTAGIVLAVTFRVYWLGSGRHMLGTYVLTFSRGDSLLLGVLLAYFWNQKKYREFMVTHRQRITLATALSLGVPLMCILGSQGIGSWGQVTAGHFGLAVCSAGAILCAILQTPARICTALRADWLRGLGKYSYSIYLWHMPVLYGVYNVNSHLGWVESSRIGHVGLTIMSLLMTILLSRLSWLLIESRFHTWGRKFEYSSL